ncbi:MAG: aspartate/glutamate racemase family protein [Geminicoccaceae bacterium]
MTQPCRIALIHATRLAIDPIEEAASRLWPDAETISILEEGLAADRARSDALTPALADRIVQLARYAEGAGADGILYTCSAFGSAIETAASTSPLPVMKPNEAMFDAAFSYGDRVSMIYTFEPAAGGLAEEFREEAERRGSEAVLNTVFSEGALDAKRTGDQQTHDRLIAETAAAIDDADVIMLAQFSMASAAPLARDLSGKPVLTSPEAAIEATRRRMADAGSEASSC